MSITLTQMLESIYGVKSDPAVNKTVSSIGVTAEMIMKANPNRLSFLVVNLSANSIYILPAPDVSSSKGIYLAANGGSANVQWDRDFELPSLEWWGVAGGAASALLVLENISI